MEKIQINIFQKYNENLEPLSRSNNIDNIKENIPILSKSIRSLRRIKFANEIEIKSLSDIIYYLFIARQATFYVKSGNLQCSTDRRRSIIDLYTLQKYYLETPLSFEQCVDIYLKLFTSDVIINKGINFCKSHKAFSSWSDKKIKEKIIFEGTSQAKYYCTTVKRNVFHTLWYMTPAEEDITEIFKDVECKIKSHEEVQTN